MYPTDTIEQCIAVLIRASLAAWDFDGLATAVVDAQIKVSDYVYKRGLELPYDMKNPHDMASDCAKLLALYEQCKDKPETRGEYPNVVVWWLALCALVSIAYVWSRITQWW